MKFDAEFANLLPEEKFPTGRDFLKKAAEKIIGDGSEVFSKEVSDLSDSEKWAICFFRKCSYAMGV